jgi:uncharacterized SAM-binding protein YcdF (DUF218 family)
MFFILSKLSTFFLLPSNIIGLAGVLGLVLTVIGWRRSGVVLLGLAVLALAIAGWSPVGRWAVMALEDRFAPFEDDGRPVAGLIVLGGSFDAAIAASRRVVALNNGAERLTEAVAFARRHPEARIVFTGGDATLLGNGAGEAPIAKRFFDQMGVPADRVTYEGGARSTAENAERLRDMLRPTPGARWLLVTSGWHMPRSIGAFRAAGFDVVAFPVDYRTRGRRDRFVPVRSVADGLGLLDLATREFVGLAAYRLSGRSSSLFPGPASADAAKPAQPQS